MSHYKTGKIGLRWRTEKEVISGKGQFVCGNKHCDRKDNLSSYEVNFSYIEAGENKQALVKLVACERCAEKLLYKKLKEKELLRQKENDRHRKKRDRSESDEDAEIDHGRSKDGRKGKGSSSANAKKMDDEDNFNEFLEGLFP